MVHTEEILGEAESRGIEVLYGNFPLSEAMSVSGYIGLDYSLLASPAREKIACTHELAHNITGGFYNRESSQLERKRAENKAEIYTIKRLLPLDDLKEAFGKGYTEPWELAEYLQLTDEFVAEALKYYTEHGYLEPDSLAG